jgi:purine-binding chemotaxis protein CheW
MTSAPYSVKERAVAGAVDRSGKYLVFALAGEEFAIPIQKVREIKGFEDITAVPQAPSYVKGVINLRGKVVPVVDLRRKFALPEVEHSPQTCIVVLQIRGEYCRIWMAVIVDGVSEVLQLNNADIECPPRFGKGVKTPYLLGLAKVKGTVKVLLDLDEVLRSNDLLRLDEALRSEAS